MLVTMSDKEIHRLPVIQAVCESVYAVAMQRHSLASQNVRRNGLSIVTGFLVLKDLSAANAVNPATVG
jgi:uridine kinase